MHAAASNAASKLNEMIALILRMATASQSRKVQHPQDPQQLLEIVALIQSAGLHELEGVMK
ncbi:unannotated protein [freshwater metagenome]|uniref:Unannotated protein n=1 Tax=freshwater metagenome TaxID=449393 RepID=A0A6J7SB32_9ZZZZ